MAPPAPPDAAISGISIDSRTTAVGDLFVAMRGGTLDGHDYIGQAIAAGASAVVGEREALRLAVPYVQMQDPRRALTWIAAAFHGWPGRRLTVTGVTGTDGKTTTTTLIHHTLQHVGIKSGMISTVNALIGGTAVDTGFHVTTPDAHDVQRMLAEMVEAGLTHVVLETTSHGWSQHRVDACEFDVGVITNITHEHLDEHGSYEEYRAAKARLLESLRVTAPKSHGNRRLAVLNCDDGSFDFLSSLPGFRRVGYGLSDRAEVRAHGVRTSASGVRFIASGSGFAVSVQTGLVGAFNVSNCLAALTAAVYGLDIEPVLAADALASAPAIPGRMERIDLGQAFLALVDFAHTPNALRAALQAGRGMLEQQQPAGGRLIVVFGSAGLRDREKRRLMAEAAVELADLSVLTAEDPRTESLTGILAEMAHAASHRGGREGETFWRVPDRGEAIRFALGIARPGDLVMACGKGHEQSMCFGKREHLWDDRIAMRAGLADLLGTEGPRMPYLPTQDKAEAEWLTST